MKKRAKGRKYKVEISGVAWVDLLGYGAMLRPIRFDPSHELAQLAVSRLEGFQHTAAASARRAMHAMIINDGVAFVREMSPRSHEVTYQFIRYAFEAYREINDADIAAGYPGARMVVAVGPRLRIDGVKRYSPDKLASIQSRLASKAISAKEAVHEAFATIPIAGAVPDLQANFAFTKAYLADSDGKKAGLAGPNCFIDSNFFSDGPPEWLTIGDEIRWATEGMDAVFYWVKAIDNERAGRLRHTGVNDADQIAARLGVSYP